MQETNTRDAQAEGRPCDIEKMTSNKSRREASEETKPAQTLILDF